jgi:hypothetical protein
VAAQAHHCIADGAALHTAAVADDRLLHVWGQRGGGVQGTGVQGSGERCGVQACGVQVFK